MNQLLVQDLWPELHRRCRTAKRRQAAVAYVTDLACVSFSAGDALVVDASDAAVKCGETSAKVLKHLFQKGVNLYSYEGLHAKVWVLDSTAIVGSANASL